MDQRRRHHGQLFCSFQTGLLDSLHSRLLFERRRPPHLYKKSILTSLSTSGL